MNRSRRHGALACALLLGAAAAAGGPPRAAGAQSRAPTYPVELVARWTLSPTPLEEPVYWQVFVADPDPFETQPLRASAVGPTARIDLAPGRYVVSASLGRVVTEGLLELWSPRTAPFELAFDAGVLEVEARRRGDEQVLAHSMSWRVYPATDPGEPHPVGDDFAAAGRFVLPAGRYRVVAVDGIARAEVELAVSAGETTRGEVAFDAGEIALRARLGPESPPIRQGVRWRVLRDGPDGGREEVASQLSPTAIFRLPTGAYTVAALFGQARGEGTLTVASGQRRATVIDLDAGIVRAEARLRTGGQTPLGDVDWRVIRIGDDGNAAAEPVAESSSESGVFTLNAGRYRIEARVGLVEASRDVEVVAGRLHDVEVELRAARLEAEGVLEGTASPTEGPLLWRLFPADAETDALPLATVEAEVAVFVLPAGAYRLVGSNRQGEGERTITLAPGREQRLQLPVRTRAADTSSRTSPGRPPRD